MLCFLGSSEFTYLIFRIVYFLFCIYQLLPEQGLSSFPLLPVIWSLQVQVGDSQGRLRYLIKQRGCITELLSLTLGVVCCFSQSKPDFGICLLPSVYFPEKEKYIFLLYFG
jgi:hypothetical protein